MSNFGEYGAFNALKGVKISADDILKYFFFFSSEKRI